MNGRIMLVIGVSFCLGCGSGHEDPGAEAEPSVEASERAAPVDVPQRPGPDARQDTVVPRRVLAPAHTPTHDTLAAATPGDTSVQGLVHVAGAVPTAQVVIQVGQGTSATRVGVRGPLRDELASLTGIEVRIWGPAVPNQPPPPRRAVEVARYEIVSVNGRNPYVGVLEQRGNEMWLASERIIQLAVVPPQLERSNGAKVWIVGGMQDGKLLVESYGIIRTR